MKFFISLTIFFIKCREQYLLIFFLIIDKNLYFPNQKLLFLFHPDFFQIFPRFIRSTYPFSFLYAARTPITLFFIKIILLK